VRYALICIFVFGTTLYAQSVQLSSSIVALIGEHNYSKHRALIGVLFERERDFIVDGGVDVVKVAEELQANRLLSLKLDSSQDLSLTLKGNADPLFFTAILDEVLRDLGYQNYLSAEVRVQEHELVDKIYLRAERAIDPTLFQRALKLRGASIVSIEKVSANEWVYTVDTAQAHLALAPLKRGETKKIKRLQYPIWLDVSELRRLNLWSLKANSWYPYIVIYDYKLNVLEVIQQDERSRKVKVDLPDRAEYVKIADLYSRKNLKSGLRVEAK